MATTTFTCNKDSRVADNGTSLGAGASDFNPIGDYSGYLYRTLLGFSYSFSGMVSITSAILHIRTSTQYYVAFSSDPDINVRRLSSSWSEGTSVSLSGSNAVEWDNQPGVTGSTATADISTSESTWDTVDITTIMQEALAAGVFYGLRLYAVDETSGDVTEIYSREQGSSDPYISVTYTTNVAPSTPTGLNPNAVELVPPAPTIEFTHVDSDGDALLKYDIQVSTDSTFASVTHFNGTNQTLGISGNNVDALYSSFTGETALTRGTLYYWRARTYSATGVLTASPWTAAQSFRVNTLPSASLSTPSATDALVEMKKVAGSGVNPRMVIRWSYSDADGGAQYSFRVDVNNDGGSDFHDSGTVVSSNAYYEVPVDPTRGNFYRVTLTVTDAEGESFSTAERRFKVNWGLAEYRIDLGATVTAWSANPTSTGGTNKSVVVEYAGSASGGAITTWYSSLGSVGLYRWFHWRVYLFAWSGASTPQMDKMSLTYTNSAAVPPDGWTATAQHALDTGTRVYGTQSLKVTCNGTALNAYQLVPVEPNTDYILSGRIKSDGNSGAQIIIATAGTGGALVVSTAIAATAEWARVVTPVWNSGANSSVYVRCYASGAGGTFAWFDALKMEASTVVTPWTPGFVGAGVTMDAGGLQVDASPAGGAVFRLQGSSGGSRATVELGTDGLLFGGDAQLWSPSSTTLRTTGTLYVGDPISTNGSGVVVSSGGSLEIVDDNGNPYIDFKNEATDDFDARIIYDLSSSGYLEFFGADVRFNGTDVHFSTAEIVTYPETSNSSFTIGGGGSATFGSKSLLWSQIGGWVFVRLAFTVTATGSGTADVTFTSTGLPSSTGNFAMWGDRGTTGVNPVVARMGPSGGETQGLRMLSMSTAGTTVIQGADLVNTAIYSFHGMYKAA